MSPTSEHTITRVRKALIKKAGYTIEQSFPDHPWYTEENDSPEILFAGNFTAAGGIFIYAESSGDFTASLRGILDEMNIRMLFCRDTAIRKVLKSAAVNFSDREEDIASADATITLCESFIARTGSILVSASSGKGRKLHGLPQHHLVIGFSDQVVLNIRDATQSLTRKYPSGLPSMMTLITGPSRTADIEKTLILGAHGPKNLIAFLLPAHLQSAFKPGP